MNTESVRKAARTLRALAAWAREEARSEHADNARTVLLVRAADDGERVADEAERTCAQIERETLS